MPEVYILKFYLVGEVANAYATIYDAYISVKEL